jgi:hypothetical protein
MQWDQFVPKSEAQLGRLARLRELCENDERDLSKDHAQHPHDKTTQGAARFDHELHKTRASRVLSMTQ